MQNFITGGAGFIGSYLTERILSHTEDSVVIYDNFSSGSKRTLSIFWTTGALRLLKAILQIKIWSCSMLILLTGFII